MASDSHALSSATAQAAAYVQEIPLPAQILIRRIIREQRAVALLEALEAALRLDPEPAPYQPPETVIIERMGGPGFARVTS
jgi:hypothetical protein